MRNVVVTGIGLVTPLGNGREESWRRLVNGESGAGRITQFDATDWPVDIACEVKDFKLSPDARGGVADHLLNRPAEYGMQSVFEAMADSGILGQVDAERFGVMVGSGIGTVKPQAVLEMMRSWPYPVVEGFPKLATFLEEFTKRNPIISTNHPASLVEALVQRWDLQGVSTVLSTACSAGAQAIGFAAREIAEGRMDAMVAGGTDSLAGEILHAGFCVLGVLSKHLAEPQKASRPFDRSRDGFVASEGAAFMILEEREHAKRRGARLYAEVAGYADSENAYRITDLPDDAGGAIAAMRGALRQAGLKPDDIDYVNAHGTSTEQNDRIESLAIKKVFYEQGAQPLVTSNKSELGHFVAAAGAVEGAMSVLSIRDGAIPPTINLHDPIDTEIRFVREEACRQPVRSVICNSFGFGGTNASLIYREVSDD